MTALKIIWFVIACFIMLGIGINYLDSTNSATSILQQIYAAGGACVGLLAVISFTLLISMFNSNSRRSLPPTEEAKPK